MNGVSWVCVRPASGPLSGSPVTLAHGSCTAEFLAGEFIQAEGPSTRV